MFSFECNEVSKNTLFTEYLWMTASAFSFSETAIRGVLWKKVFLKILQNLQENTCGLRNFQNTSGRLLLAFLCNFTNNVWKTSDEYSLSTNSNLRSIVQVYHFFLGSINVQSMFSLVYTVYCQKPAPEVKVFCKKRYSEKFCKFHWKTPVLESLFNKVAGLTRILKNICQQLLLHSTHTTHCYLSVLLYIQHLLTHHHCYYC